MLMLSERAGDSAARCASIPAGVHGATRSDEHVVNYSMPPPAVSPNAPSRPATRLGAARSSLAEDSAMPATLALRQRPLLRTTLLAPPRLCCPPPEFE